MRYCLSCRKMTSGDPAYCNYCGKSYDVKLCGRGHVNPRGAEVCSECGSRDLSIPQQRGGILLKVLISTAIYLPSIVLLAASFGYLVLFVRTLFEDSNALLPIMLLGLALGLFWLIWMAIVAGLRSVIQEPRSKRKRE